jgi:hypothetical protein
MTNKPKPIKYTTLDGGVWQLWRDDVQRLHVHAVMFEDGSVFDAVNGWRKEEYCPCCGAPKFGMA